MPNLFINMLREWYEAKELKYIDITEISKLDSSNIEYNIIYQAFFSSKNYEFMTFNIYLTESLFVGIAIENYSRIANRIGVNSPFKERVAGGWEPPSDGIDKRPDYSHFFKSIEEISAGQIAVVAFTSPFVGLYSAKLKTSELISEKSELKKDRASIKILPNFNPLGVKHLVNYKPWE